MIKLLKHNQNITFKEDTHQYFTEKGVELTSVSRVIDFFKPEFDPQGHITRACARREGISVQEMRDRWQKINDEANEKGHNFHKQAEHFINTGVVLDADFKDVVKQIAEIKYTGKLYSEVRLADTKNFQICGTTDFLEELDGKKIICRDFKTNKRFEKKNKYKTKMLPPFEEYDVCEFNTYSFQLGIYSYILEINGYNVIDREVYYVNPETRKIEIYKMPEMKKQVIKMLNHFQNITKW